GRGTVGPGSDRPLHSYAAHLRAAGADAAGRGRRAAAYRWSAAAAERRKTLCLQVRRQASRYWRQGGLLEGHGGVCAEARGSGRWIAAVAEGIEAVASSQ